MRLNDSNLFPYCHMTFAKSPDSVSTFSSSKDTRPGMEVQAYNSSTWEVDVGFKFKAFWTS